MARGSWVSSELESRLSVWVVAEMEAQPGCPIGHRRVEGWAGACRWQAPRSIRVDDVGTGLASTGEISPGREPRATNRDFRVSSTNERWSQTGLLAIDRRGTQNPGVQTAKIHALLLRGRRNVRRMRLFRRPARSLDARRGAQTRLGSLARGHSARWGPRHPSPAPRV